jgi:hypothetical protein
MMGIHIAWSPITEAEKKLSAPLVEPGAGAEALFWEVRVIDEITGEDLQRAFYHYIRLKVFTEKGREQASTVDIPYDSKTSILDVAGRTIKADGTIVELKKDAVHERDIVRGTGLRRRVKSFAMPAVEPGAIVEYRWKEIKHNPNVLYTRLQFQREVPVHKVSYFVKPLSSDYTAGYRMGVWPFNCRPTPLKLDERTGFTVTTLDKVPAFKEEPLMPAEPNVRPWLLLFYHNKTNREPESYWSDVGKDIYSELKRTVKVTDPLKKATEKALAGVPEQDKVAALIQYVRKNVKGIFDDTVTDAERLKLVKSMPKDRRRHSGEVFESGIGTADELNSVFAAMATHAGLDARPVLVSDRADVMFTPQMADRYFLNSVDIGVKQGDKWTIYDVSAKQLPARMLSWNEAGGDVLISDPKKPVFVKATPAAPEDSETKRTASLTLAADGTLSGTIEEAYTGYAAYERRMALAGESEAKRLERLKDAVSRSIAKAEVADLVLKNVEDPEQPLVVSFKITAPQYAQRTGKRMFLQPEVFKRGDPPMFASTERTHDIHLRFPWKEIDDIRIALPEGYEIDGASNPGGLDFGKPGGYTLVMGLDGRTLTCKRTLIFGANDILMFPKQAYPALKQAFDEIYRRDNQSISLKQAAAAAGL